MNIGIVNDIPVVLESLRRTLAQVPQHQVIWQAHNGEEAVSKCAQQRPDLILMDLLMPVMDGVEATRRIMAATPCPILLVTMDVERNMPKVFEAMGYGALDVVEPGVDSRPLLRKIQNIAWMNGTVSSLRGAPARAAAPVKEKRIVAIGASAGGPPSLARLLGSLPQNFNAAVVLVQHVDEVFAAGMAQWLATESRLPVRLARDGEAPRVGEVLLAGTNHHLCLQRDGLLAYTDAPKSHVYRPSIDVFFESLVAHWRGQAVGVLLTGMGRDGAKGLLHMRQRGFWTIAQDRASSAVYGMPKAAADLNAASEILALEKIAPRLTELFA